MLVGALLTAAILLAGQVEAVKPHAEDGELESGPKRFACRDAPSTLRNAEFTLAVGRVHLSDGKGCAELLLPDFPCDWLVELRRVELWRHEKLLLVVLNANHETGSGAWRTVLVYACENGIATPVFSQRYLYGAKITIEQDKTFSITSGLWRATDPHCCPSRELRERYDWDERTRSVVRVESITVNRAE